MSEENTQVDETANFVTATSELEALNIEPETDAGAEVEEVESATEQSQETDSNNETDAAEEDGEAEKVESEIDADGENTTEQPTGKKSRGVQKRINKIIKERETERRAKDDLQKRFDALEAKNNKPVSTSDKTPVETDFPTYDKYLDAVDAFEAGQAKTEGVKPEVKTETATKDDQSLTDNQQVALAVIQDVVANADKPKDFDEVALNDSVPISPSMLEALAECDNQVDIMYHLGKNTAIAQEIADKSPAQQMRAIAQLDMTVKPFRPEKTVKLTNTKEPIQPVKKASSAAQKSESEMTFGEFEAYRNAQERG
jgi:hypothetical protein